MLFNSLLLGLRARSVLQAEIIALRHQLIGAATKLKTKAARPQSRRSLPVGLAFASVVGLAFLLNHRVAGKHFGGFRCQIHGSKSETAITDVENVPQQSRLATRLNGLLHCANRLV
jgi:hypothetical protein